MTAEQIFFYQSIGRSPIPDGDAYQTYLLNEQNTDGSWSLAPHEPGDISTSCEAYLALKILGTSLKSPEMCRARDFILGAGGVAKVRMFTRIYFAQFGLFPWTEVPELPAEFILMPSNGIMNIYRLSSWARSTIIPLLIISHHRPVYALPNGRHTDNDYLDELWMDAARKIVPYGPSLWRPWENDMLCFFFGAVDSALHLLGGLRRFPTRGYSRKRCVQWILEHQEKSGDWAGIIPPMHAGVQALLLEGYHLEDDVIQRAIEAIERFTWQDEQGKRLQSCVSPLWDTVLMTRAICDAGVNRTDERLQKAVQWIKGQQNFGSEGDWRIYNPRLAPGGFSFEYSNAWYPDCDDTAAAILALLHQDPSAMQSASVDRAAIWLCGMQNCDSGWGAFDLDNDRMWLNRIPFSDMNALCDPSTADVTGHVLEAFGFMLKLANEDSSMGDRFNTISIASQKAIHYLAREQESNGAWYGRWGANYIYGTSNVVCGLAYFTEHNNQVKNMISSAANWLISIQNADGGWGEGLDTYLQPHLAGKGHSTPSQTAWALMALLASCDTGSPAIQAGIDYLLSTQTDLRMSDQASSWPEERYTGVGFPNFFYLGYTLYRHYFPMMALGRFVDMVKQEGHHVDQK